MAKGDGADYVLGLPNTQQLNPGDIPSAGNHQKKASPCTMPIIWWTRMLAACKRQCSAIMVRNAIRLSLAAVTAVFVLADQATGGQTPPSAPPRAQPPLSVRLYVIDCGTLHITDMGRFQLKKEEVATTDLSVACFLVVHPKGKLIWDTGTVPDAAWKPTGSPVTQHVVLPDSQQREITLVKSLKGHRCSRNGSSRFSRQLT